LLANISGFHESKKHGIIYANFAKIHFPIGCPSFSNVTYIWYS
jgi:hypothetical protein